MNKVWEHTLNWLKANMIILITVMVLAVLRFVGMRQTQMAIDVEILLAIISILASHALGHSKNKILISVSCVAIGFLAHIGPVAAVAILSASAFMLEDGKKTLFYFVLMAILLIEEHFALNGFITGNKTLNLVYQCGQLVALFTLIRMRGIQAPAVFALILFVISGAAKLDVDNSVVPVLFVMLFLASLLARHFTHSILALGMTWAVISSSLALGLIAISLMVVNMLVEKFDKKDAAAELIPLVMIVSFANYSSWIASLVMAIFVLKIAFNNRMQTCLMKSRL